MAKTRSDREEVTKYIKFFAYKAVQIIVHSRTGERTKTFSKANAVGVDWFNIALPRNNIGNDIQKEIKSEFGNKKIVIDEPLWLYVYLKTSEGYDSLLEGWSIGFNQKVDQNVKSAFTVYNKLTLLLKSIVSVSRSLPSYRLTRRKEKDFSFSYKICTHELEPLRVARMSGTTRIGSVGTPFGTIVLSVQFQTVIDCFSSENGKSSAMVDDPKPKVLIRMNEDETLESLRPPDPAIVEELCRAALDDVTSSTHSLPTSFRPISSHSFNQSGEGQSNLDLNDILQPLSIGDLDDNHRALAAFGEVSMENSELEFPEMPSTPPLLSMIQSKIGESTTSSSVKSKETEDVTENSGDDSKTVEDKVLLAGLDNTDSGETEPRAHAVGFEDDFVLVEVRPAFEPQTGDAGQLYRECQNPPQLDMFTNNSNYDSDNDDSITDQIERYESQLAQYDEFFRNLEHMKVN